MASDIPAASVDLTTLNCDQLQALAISGDQQIEQLYIDSRTNPSDPLSGAPRLTIYGLQHPASIDQSNPLWLDIYRAQLSWRSVKSMIIQRQRTLGCFQMI